jgi:predicted PurR-regulated permease PerM
MDRPDHTTVEVPQGAAPGPLARRLIVVRSAALALVALAAALYLMRWAQEVIVPVLFGVFVSYALTPFVDRLERWGIPRVAGAATVVCLILAGLGCGGYALQGEADDFITALPQITQRVREAVVGGSGRPDGRIARVQRAANEIASAAALPEAAPSSGASAPARAGWAASQPRHAAPVTHVVIDEGGFKFRDYLVSGTLSVLRFVGQALVVVFVALFLLAGGNRFRGKMVKLAGPRLTQKKVTIQVLDEIHAQMQRYLIVQIATSALVGVLTWLAFLAIGLDNSAVWGIVASVSNLVPYLGALVLGVTSTVVGLEQFGALRMGLLLGAASFAIHGLVGNVLTPWLAGRSSRMSPFVVFVGVVFFGWLWGIAGLILAFPILGTVKIVCDSVEDLKPVGELLGD